MQNFRPGTNVDALSKLEGFMLARETLAENPNVLAFLDKRNAYDIGATPSQEDLLYLKSGYTGADGTFSAAAASGEKARGEDRETEDQKREKTVRTLTSMIQQQYRSLLQDVEQHQQNIYRLSQEYDDANKKLEVQKERMQTANEAAKNYEEYRPSVTDARVQQINTERGQLEAAVDTQYNDLGPSVMRDVGGTQIEYKQVTVDGNTYFVNKIGYMVDENGNGVSDEKKAEIFESDDPGAKKLKEFSQSNKDFSDYKRQTDHQLKDAAERTSILNYKEYVSEELKAAEQAVDQKAKEISEEQKRLEEAQQKLQQFKSENPNATVNGMKVSLNDSGDYVDESGKVVSSDLVMASVQDTQNNAAQPVQVAMLSPGEYDSNKAARQAVTDTTGFVGDEKIETKSLINPFRTASLGEAKPDAPDVAVPPVQSNDIARDSIIRNDFRIA